MIDLSGQKHSICLSLQAQRGVSFFLTVDQGSYVTGDKIYCVYIAPNEDLIREHAKKAGIPASKISEVKAIIDPSMAE